MNKTIHTLIIFCALAGLNSCGDDAKNKPFGECSTNQDATNMMIASQVHMNKLRKTAEEEGKVYKDAYVAYQKEKLKSSSTLKRINQLNKKMGDANKIWVTYVDEITKVSELINAQEYQKSCDTYISIAKKYGANLEEDAKTTISMTELKKGGACALEEASVLFMFFREETNIKGEKDNPDVKELIQNSGLTIIQNPSKLCKQIENISKQINISYSDLMQRVNKHLAKNKENLNQRRTVQESNAKHNKNCTSNDAIDLSYKQEKFSNGISELYEKWHKKYNNARNASLQNSKLNTLLLQKRKEVSDLQHVFFETFKKEVKIHITTGKYDLACANYTKLEKEYTKKLSELEKDYDTFGKSSVVKNKKNDLNSTSKSKSASSTNDYDSLSKQKYNYFVHVLNKITPKIRNTYSRYVRECGNDKKKRVRARVEEAVKSNDGKNRKVYEDAYGYQLGRPYSKEETAEVLNTFTEILAIDRFKYADVTIIEFKKYVSEFMKLYSEDAEYFDMKDYIDDNFKKANALHAPIIIAFENMMKSDISLRKIVNDISDKQTLNRIKKYKENNEMLYYHVEKGQYLSKKFLEFGKHKKNYINLDAKLVRKKHDELREYYEVFKKYRQDNETLFKDNRQYIEYLKTFKEYVSISKEFYIRVKSKKAYTSDEEEYLKNIPASARATMEVNMEGSLPKLLNSYNNLVHKYNILNR